MITLYYHRGACSTSNHFALEEAGVEYEAIEVDLKLIDDPLVLKVRALNPMAQTPVVVLDDGKVLTQNAATLPFIADLAPEKMLLPPRGTSPDGDSTMNIRPPIRREATSGSALAVISARPNGGRRPRSKRPVPTPYNISRA